MLLKITIVILLISNILLWIWIAKLKLIIRLLVRDAGLNTKIIKDLNDYIKSMREGLEKLKDEFKDEEQ